MQPGGQLIDHHRCRELPRFADIIQGPWLMEQMEAQAKHVGTKIILDQVNALDLSRRPFVALGDSGDSYSGDSVIVATGAQARWLGVRGRRGVRGFGVSACATCDGSSFATRRSSSSAAATPRSRRPST